jgi:hypothetical protein
MLHQSEVLSLMLQYTLSAAKVVQWFDVNINN